MKKTAKSFTTQRRAISRLAIYLASTGAWIVAALLGGGEPALAQPQVVFPEVPFDAFTTEPNAATPGILSTPAPLETTSPFSSPFSEFQIPQLPGIGIDGENQPKWIHRTGVFGEFLYLTSRSDVPYAVRTKSVAPPVSPPVQIGPVAQVEGDYDAGFRVGFSYAWDTIASFVASYMTWENSETDRIVLTPAVGANETLTSLVRHPSVANAALATVLGAAARLEMDLDVIDADYRTMLAQGDFHAVNFFAGARYGNTSEHFRAGYTDDPELDFSAGPSEVVATDVDFEGAGLRVGLDGERHSCARRWLVYGRGAFSVLFGQVDAHYFQGAGPPPFAEQVSTSWEDDRVVPILDLELGVGWQSRTGRVRLTAGYLASVWFNLVPTADFIEAVQENEFHDVEGAITFDGLTARAEVRW